MTRWGSGHCCGQRALVRAQAHFGREALVAMFRPLHRWSLLLLLPIYLDE